MNGSIECIVNRNILIQVSCIWLPHRPKIKVYKEGKLVDKNININVNQNIIQTKEKKERSDMEKILIKNAKIDALASIDPTNTEKAKEQIDIVNKLDDLD